MLLSNIYYNTPAVQHKAKPLVYIRTTLIMRIGQLLVGNSLIQFGAIVVVLRNGYVRQAAMRRCARSVIRGDGAINELQLNMICMGIANSRQPTSFLSQHLRP